MLPRKLDTHINENRLAVFHQLQISTQMSDLKQQKELCGTEGNMWEAFQDLDLGKGLFERTTQATREKSNKQTSNST